MVNENLLKPSKQEQMMAVFNGRASDLIKQHYSDANEFNFTSFLTFTKRDLIRFLTANPEIMKTYAEKSKFPPQSHDVCTINSVPEGYMVAWLDHGTPMNPKVFSNLEEAVAEQVLARYGIYSR